MQTILNYTAAKGARFAHAVGVILGLKDAQVPPQPRDATKAEAEKWLWGRAIQAVVDVEGREKERARGPVVVDEMELT